MDECQSKESRAWIQNYHRQLAEQQRLVQEKFISYYYEHNFAVDDFKGNRIQLSDCVSDAEEFYRNVERNRGVQQMLVATRESIEKAKIHLA